MEISDLAELYGKELHIKQISKWLRGSARAQEIAKRSELDSSDGNVIDIHDQFFRDHKLLLVLFRVSFPQKYFFNFIYTLFNKVTLLVQENSSRFTTIF